MSRILHITCFLAGFALLAVAVWFRCWDLSRLPGVNGDEAWYGVQAERMLHGRCVSLRTPTGNPWNPFFMAPQVALHGIADPSFALLRMPAVMSGIAALLVNLVLCRRAFGLRMARLTTLIHAVLPLNIAYSRFAWDASQSLLFTLPVVYAGVLAYQERHQRLRWTMIGLLSLVAARLVHPTNVFVTPFFVVLVAAAWRERMVAAWQQPKLRAAGLILLGSVLSVAVVLLSPRLSANLGSADNYTAFAKRFSDLFTGVAVYEYIPGSLIPDAARSANVAVRIGLDSLAIASAMLAAFALQRMITRGRSLVDRWLVIGWAASVAAFFAIAGPAAIAPHFERYAICLIAPTVLLLGRGLNWWMQPTTRLSAATAPLLLIAAAGVLATFKSQYFDEFNQRGGRSHLTFRTAAIEPKQQAMDLIAAHRQQNVPLLIQTSEWWLYWPLQYLAHTDQHVSVELRSADDPRPVHQQAIAGFDTWIIEFADSDAGRRLKRSMPNTNHLSRNRPSVVRFPAERNLLLLLRLSYSSVAGPSGRHDEAWNVEPLASANPPEQ